MKQKYQAAVDRFILDQGPNYRYLNRRWWIQTNGYWTLGGRATLERDLTGFIHLFAPPLVSADLNQSDLNQVCAYLSRKLYTTALPARSLAPEDDSKLIMWGTRPRLMMSDLELRSQ